MWWLIVIGVLLACVYIGCAIWAIPARGGGHLKRRTPLVAGPGARLVYIGKTGRRYVLHTNPEDAPTFIPSAFVSGRNAEFRTSERALLQGYGWGDKLPSDD